MMNGIPAVKIHDNIVVHPFGQSLYIMAMGPVSVLGNHFTSQGTVTTNRPSISMLAGTVIIIDLGLYQYILSMVLPSSGAKGAKYVAQSLPILPSGHILFSNNQITCDLRVAGQAQGIISQFISSQFIASLDDVSYESNQSECLSLGLFSDLMLLAVTARTNRNRFQEIRSTINFSLISWAIANMCTHNQASNNIFSMGMSKEGFTITEPNTIGYRRDLSQFDFDIVKTYFQQIATAFLLGLNSTS